VLIFESSQVMFNYNYISLANDYNDMVSC